LQALVVAAIESDGGYRSLFLDFCGKLLSDNKVLISYLTTEQAEQVMGVISVKNREQGYPMTDSLKLILFGAVTFPESTCLVNIVLENLGPFFTDAIGQFKRIPEQYDIIYEHLRRLAEFVFCQYGFTKAEELFNLLLRNYSRFSQNGLEDLISYVVSLVLSFLGPMSTEKPLCLPDTWAYTSIQLRNFINAIRPARTSAADMSFIDGYISLETEMENIYSSCDVLLTSQNLMNLEPSFWEKFPRSVLYVLKKYVNANYYAYLNITTSENVEISEIYTNFVNSQPYFMVDEDADLHLLTQMEELSNLILTWQAMQSSLLCK